MTVSGPLATGSPLPPGPAAPAPGERAAPVTATFVRLKLAVLRNGVRQSRGRTVSWCIGVGLAMLYALGNGAGMIALRGSVYAPAAAVTMAAVLAIGWSVMPLFFFGGDDTLDPTRLAMLPLRPRPLIVALLTSSMIGAGPLFTLLVGTGAVVAVAHGVAGTVVAVPAVILLLAICAALSRGVAAANTRLLTSRKGRDLALLSGLIVAVGAQLVNLALSSLSSHHDLHRVTSVTSVLRWIPPASAVDAVQSVSDGAYGRAAAQLALAVIVLAVVLRWWYTTLHRLMMSPDSSTLQPAPDSTERKGSSRPPLLARLLPARWAASRTATVTERQFRYVARDPRLRASWATGLAVGLLLPLVAVVQHGSVYQCLWTAGLLGLQMYNQFGMDNSAFWTIAATITSRQDAEAELRGRALMLSAVALPYVTVVTCATALLLGKTGALPEVLGMGLAFLGALISTGAYASVRFPYTVAQDNAFGNAAPGNGSLVAFNALGGSVVASAFCLPVLGLDLALHLTGHHALLWTVLPIGAVYALALSVVGLRFTAPRMFERLPEILSAVSGP
ncbi:ABC-2 type transport system permease protein [Actinacidiphila yanglinensis]|uniref:ABC-2 type transport system permease protein n=1 Tax=Actinacidiphila yanglinensis TaxID=310779 RepID=A0A1H5Z8S1_9ACTN|nr:transporter [Actinacidiphila yanglinensis]SEG32758.1 ABC-2 type transport system permease protein [Actinacidiphila yanglinensis]